MKGDDLHFVPIPYSGRCRETICHVLKAEDYPKLIPPGGIDTVAVPAILAAYSWAPKTERYSRVEHS